MGYNYRMMRMSLGILAVLMASVVLVMLVPLVAVADSSTDCGRFYLKKDRKSGASTCVNGSAGSSTGVGAEIQTRLKFVNAAVEKARKLLKRNEITPHDEERIRGLLDQAKQRAEEIKVRIRSLTGDQKSFVLRRVADERRLIDEQSRITDELVREQKTRTQGLFSAQRGRTQGLRQKQRQRSRGN